MSLSGLLDAVRPDPGVAAVLDAATAGGVSTLDVVAPAGVRPLVVAGIAAAAARPPRHRHRPRGRGPRRGPALLPRPARRSPSSPPGRRCRTSGSAPGPTPSAAGSPCSAASRTRTPERRRPAPSGCSSRRSAPSCSRSSPASASSRRCACAAGDDAGLEDDRRARSSTPPTPAPTWSSGAASSPSAAASSTSSRPPRTTRCASSSGATRSRRSAGSPSPTSAPWRSRRRACGRPPCREILLTDAVRARAAALVDRLPGVADMLGKISEGIAVEGMESLAPALVDEMQPLLDLLPDGTHVVLVDPEKIRTRAHDLVATSEEFLAASWANASAGNELPIDLSARTSTCRPRPTGRWPGARPRARRRDPVVVAHRRSTADAETSDDEIVTRRRPGGRRLSRRDREGAGGPAQPRQRRLARRRRPPRAPALPSGWSRSSRPPTSPPG